MVLTTEIFGTIAGNPIMGVPASSAPWTTRVNGGGSCSFTFQAKSLGFDPDMCDRVFRERANTIAVCDGNDVVYAGPIMRTVMDDDAGTITCDTTEMRTYTRWRMTAGVDSPKMGDLFASGLSASGAVRRIIQRSTQWGARWMMPIDLPADGTGDFAIASNWYDHDYIEDLIQQVEARGIEVVFRPYKTTGGFLRFQTVVAEKYFTGSTDLPRSVAQSALSQLKRTRDSVKSATGVLGTGQGSGSDMILGHSLDRGPGDLPISDIIRPAMEADTVAKVTAIAEAEATAYGYPIEQWSFSTTLNEGAVPLTYQHVMLGRRLRIDIRKHWAIQPGIYDHRVIALKGDLTGAVTPEVQRYG